MQIDSRAAIEGVSLVDIRSLFRDAGLDGTVSVGLVRERLKLSRSKSDRLLRELVRAGFLNREKDCWLLTKEGVRLRAATAARPLHRNTADRLLENLLARIQTLNADPRFLARVEKAIVFGSYVSNAGRLGDIDIAIELARREPDYDKHLAANYQRVIEEGAKGRRFSNMLDMLCWWQREAMLFLRNRKRSLSLHDYGSIREMVNSAPHTVLFPIQYSR